MGLNIKKIHGKEFLYFLYEKKSILIGPKGEYEKGNLENVKIAIKRNDAKVDKFLQKYVDDVAELSRYMPEPERKEYLSKRTAELLARLRLLEKENWDLIQDVLGFAMKKVDKTELEKIARNLQKKYG